MLPVLPIQISVWAEILLQFHEKFQPGLKFKQPHCTSLSKCQNYFKTDFASWVTFFLLLSFFHITPLPTILMPVNTMSFKSKQVFWSNRNEKYFCLYLIMIFFISTGNLHIRYKTQQINTSFKCKHCSKCLKRKDHLWSHETVHSEERPHEC